MKSGTQAEEEDGGCNEANRDAPFENGWRVGLRCDLRHWPFQAHGQQDDIHAVENHAQHNEECPDEKHGRLCSEPWLGQ